MSSKESRRQKNINYKGTIVPQVGRLMNQCVGYGKEFRIITEDEYNHEKTHPIQHNMNRMTIVVKKNSGELELNFWG